jgi:hypothetical protein
MRVRITRTTVASDGFVRVGQVVDLPEADAKMLIAIHKAVPVDDEPEAPTVIDTEVAEPVVETKLKRARRAK